MASEAELRAEVGELKRALAHHKNNVIETYARLTTCSRHRPQMRMCVFRDAEPCGCRRAVAAWWPEYAVA